MRPKVMERGRLRVLHVMAGAEHGGAETYFVDAILNLDEAGVRQAVMTRPGSLRLREIRRRRLPLYLARFSRLRRGPTTRLLERAVTEFAPDIIQYWMGRAASFAVGRRAANVGWLGGYYDLKRFRHCPYLVGVTDDIVRHAVAEGAVPSQTRRIETFAAKCDDAPTSRGRLDTPEDVPLVLALGRLHRKKGFDILLRALAEIPHAWLWIAGEGPERRPLERLADRLGLAQRVRFLGWRPDRAALLKAADLCALPSRDEPFGTVMAEAWAAGTPLVAAESAGPGVYVTHGASGLLVPVGHAPALARAITEVLGDGDLGRRLALGGRAAYEARFTPEIHARSWLGFYADVIARERATTVRHGG